MLSLNAISINLKSLQVTASQTLAEKDASGQSSSIHAAETQAKTVVS